jgi:hypothetical protein
LKSLFEFAASEFQCGDIHSISYYEKAVDSFVLLESDADAQSLSSGAQLKLSSFPRRIFLFPFFFSFLPPPPLTFSPFPLHSFPFFFFPLARSGEYIVSRPQSKISPEEKTVRVQLAAAYRLFDLFGWTDLIYNHLTVRIPGRENEFLINPFGLLFSEITASNLVKVATLLHRDSLSSSPLFFSFFLTCLLFFFLLRNRLTLKEISSIQATLALASTRLDMLSTQQFTLLVQKFNRLCIATRRLEWPLRAKPMGSFPFHKTVPLLVRPTTTLLRLLSLNLICSFLFVDEKNRRSELSRL